MAELSLEKSWQSLDFFSKSHSGRLTADCEIDRALSMCEISEESEEESNDTEDFVIPELPAGETLEFRLISTWGDPFYVGLNGIEVFTDSGGLAKTETLEALVTESSARRSVVPDCSKVENLLDGAYRTRDDTRLWLAPFAVASPVVLRFKFAEPASIAMIRIWNYNKSRVHASRGARLVEITLDGATIFRGEISKAEGLRESDSANLGDTILFTTDDTILEAIRQNDQSVDGGGVTNGPVTGEERLLNANQLGIPVNPVRPNTGDQRAKKVHRQNASMEEPTKPTLEEHEFSCDGDLLVVKGKVFTFELTSNWGSIDFIGFAGFQLIGRGGKPVLIPKEALSSSAQPNNIRRLVDGQNLTTDSDHMWLTTWNGRPGDVSSAISITITLPTTVDVCGFSLWNYNVSEELSYSGVRKLNVYANGKLLNKDVLIRKAPGSLYFDYVQDVFFLDYTDTTIARPPTGNFCGFIYQIRLLSTWGDDYYVGLNGLQLFDASERPVVLGMNNLAAYPESVNVLPSVNGDPRTSDKLIDGLCDTDHPEHMWLAPVLPHEINRIFIVFDRVTELSKIVLWNYRKTPCRGVREVAILVDDLIVYSGEVEQSTKETTGQLTVRFSQMYS